jgi:anthranilate synthase component 1
MAKVQLNLAQVLELSKSHRVLPIVETLFSGTETPLSIFEKLAASKPGSFLLESAQHGVWARYSFIGVNNRGTLVQSSGEGAKWLSPAGNSAFADGTSKLPSSTLDAVAAIQKSWMTSPVGELPPLTSGLIREIENLAKPAKKDFASPVIALAMFQDLVVLDHETSSLLLVSNIFVDDGADVASCYNLALDRIDTMRRDLLKPSDAVIADVDFTSIPESSNRTKAEDFLASIESAKEYVRAGEVFQVVISQRFDVQTQASPLDIYRVLRALNPSPYMYLLNFEDETGPYAIVGSSPEALVSVLNGKATTHPIAGSRPRGADADLDHALEVSLLEDNKEKSEHLMLVDLARNDLLKVCEPQSVTVTEFMQVHKFSHIMHLVSTVEGLVSKD